MFLIIIPTLVSYNYMKQTKNSLNTIHVLLYKGQVLHILQFSHCVKFTPIYCPIFFCCHYYLPMAKQKRRK